METSDEIKQVIKRLSDNDQMLDFNSPTQINSDLQSYLNYYNFDHENIDHHFGKVKIDDVGIVVQIFAPKKSMGTIILLHGYLDHVGNLNHIINFLNKQNYTVVSYDLQGHGLSEGKVASIEQFADYVSVLEKLMIKVKQEMNGPFIAIGHSTGGAIIANYVLTHNDHSFIKIILVAPLVRSNHWFVSKLGIYIAKYLPFIQSVKRRFKKNSNDKDYLKSVRQDPLQPEIIPVNWTEALFKWNEKIRTYPAVYTNTCMIQGTSDTTVAWRYNLNFLIEKFPCSKMVHIENGKHALFNESAYIRKLVNTYIHQFIMEE